MSSKAITLLLILTWIEASVAMGAPGATVEPVTPPGFVQYGEMHEAIGRHQDQVRIAFSEIRELPEFYGIGALEGLKAEITVIASRPIVTGVTADGAPQPLDAKEGGATLLAGASIHQWVRIPIEQDVSPENVDSFVRGMAKSAGVDVQHPFVFVIDGEFRQVRLHVLNGACPIQARMKEIDLPDQERPFELEKDAMHGTVVGVYAYDAVGKLTHPDTSTHMHLVYEDPTSGDTITGHLERVGLVGGCTLRLPDPEGSR